MPGQPTIQTERLILRPFTTDDAADCQRLAGDKDIAATTILIPHPYPDGAAEEWIATHQETFEKGEAVIFAITLRDGGDFIGAVGLTITARHHHAELGYWVGKPYWSQGYCTEAARAMLDYAFNTLNLNRVHAHHFASNAASGKVMEKIGMQYEGLCREHILKWGGYVDIRLYGILKTDYDSHQST
ncbi:MAG: GNAT family N-acetyltransferase [Phycisphaerales bacterium]|nr:MAG: GNAT family N-acetyltransferase [Phycisphaerales bacterium]